MPKRDGRDLARVIATNAERDAVAVEKMAPDAELADEVVGLHAQQAAEKYLKAVLAYRGDHLPARAQHHLPARPARGPRGPARRRARAELETLTPWAPQARYDHDTEGADPRPRRRRWSSSRRCGRGPQAELTG